MLRLKHIETFQDKLFLATKITLPSPSFPRLPGLNSLPLSSAHTLICHLSIDEIFHK